jgi:hypothetical protein
MSENIVVNLAMVSRSHDSNARLICPMVCNGSRRAVHSRDCQRTSNGIAQLVEVLKRTARCRLIATAVCRLSDTARSTTRSSGVIRVRQLREGNLSVAAIFVCPPPNSRPRSVSDLRGFGGVRAARILPWAPVWLSSKPRTARPICCHRWCPSRRVDSLPGGPTLIGSK